MIVSLYVIINFYSILNEFKKYLWFIWNLNLKEVVWLLGINDGGGGDF